MFIQSRQWITIDHFIYNHQCNSRSCSLGRAVKIYTFIYFLSQIFSALYFWLFSQTLSLSLVSLVPACVVSSWKLCTMLRSWSRLKWVAGSPAVTLSTSCACADPGITVPVSEVRVSGDPGPSVSTGKVTSPPPGSDMDTEPGYEGGGGSRLESEAVSSRDSSTWRCEGYQRSSCPRDLKHTQQSVEDRGRGRINGCCQSEDRFNVLLMASHSSYRRQMLCPFTFLAKGNR